MKRRSIRGKLLASVSSAVLLFVVASISSAVLQRVTNQKMDSISVAQEELSLAQSLDTAVHAADDDAAWYFMSRTQQNQDKYNKAYQSDLLTISKESTSLHNVAQKSDVKDFDAFEQAWATYQVGNSESFQFKQSSSSMAVSMFTQVPFDAVIQPLVSFIQKTKVNLNAMESQIHSLESMNTMISILATIIAAITGLMATYFVGNRIVRSFHDIRNAQLAIANGNLSISLPTMSANDELRDLSETTEAMAAQLRSLIGEIERTASDVISSADHLSNGVAASSGAALRITSKLKMMKDQVNQQQLAALENSSAMKETARGIYRIAEASTLLRDASRDSLSNALSGRARVSDATFVMESVDSSMTQSTILVDGLGDKIQQVGHIVSTIQNFAKETNLLALNAAIEAGRAGEQGRGFSVVATEIRALADQSTASSKRISDLLGDIQEMAVASIDSMRRTRENVEKSKLVVTQLGNSFADISAQTETVYQQIEDISSVTEQISATTQQVAASVEETSNMAISTHQEYDALNETTETQLREIGMLGDLAQGLLDVAAVMQKKTRWFQIEQ